MQSAYAVESLGAPKLSGCVPAPFSHLQARRLRGVVLMISPVRPAAWQFVRRPASHNGPARAALVSPATADNIAITCHREANAIRRPEFSQLGRSVVVLRSFMIAPVVSSYRPRYRRPSPSAIVQIPAVVSPGDNCTGIKC